MKRLTSIMLTVTAVLMIGGVGFLATWDIPAPAASKEKVLSDERFPR